MIDGAVEKKANAVGKITKYLSFKDLATVATQKQEGKVRVCDSKRNLNFVQMRPVERAQLGLGSERNELP